VQKVSETCKDENLEKLGSTKRELEKVTDEDDYFPEDQPPKKRERLDSQISNVSSIPNSNISISDSNITEETENQIEDGDFISPHTFHTHNQRHWHFLKALKILFEKRKKTLME